MLARSNDRRGGHYLLASMTLLLGMAPFAGITSRALAGGRPPANLDAQRSPGVPLNDALSALAAGVQPNARQQQPVTITLKSASTEVNHTVQNTSDNGNFTIDVGSLAPGTYNWRVKGPKFLANAGSVTLSGSPATNLEMGLMLAGDADNNNVVNVSDFTIMRATFGKSAGQPGYDDRGDFNNDGVVNTTDVSLHKSNNGRGGAPPVGP